MDHLRQAQEFRVAQERALSQLRHSNSSSHPSNPNAFPLQPPSLPQPLLFTTNPALRMSDAEASLVLDTMTAALPQDSSRLFD